MFWYIYGIVVLAAHIPITIDIIRFAFPQFKLTRISHGTRYILVVAAGIIGCTGLGELLFVFLPIYVPDPFHTFTGWLHIVFALWLWVNTVINYFMALFIHPGTDAIPSNSSKPGRQQVISEQVGQQPEDVSSKMLGSDVRNRTTDTRTPNEVDSTKSSASFSLVSDPNGLTDKKDGMQWKPTRGNYCKICKFHVAFMDHHCPYTGGCFGLNNYSYFYIGMCYGITGAVYALILTAPLFWKCDVKYFLAYLNIVGSGGLETEICEKIGTQSRAFIPVAFGLWLAGMMLIGQNILLLADVSTYNVLKNSARVPILKFMRDRIRGRKFLQPDSRLNILVLSQRARWYHYLMPVRNMQTVSSSQLGVYSI